MCAHVVDTQADMLDIMRSFFMTFDSITSQSSRCAGHLGWTDKHRRLTPD